MITQRDLRETKTLTDEVRAMEALPEVCAYIVAKKRAEDALAGLRKRVDEGVQIGKLRATFKEVFSVSWEKVHSTLQGRTSIQIALAGDPEAQALIAQAQAKDPSAPFVSRRINDFQIVCG